MRRSSGTDSRFSTLSVTSWIRMRSSTRICHAYTNARSDRKEALASRRGFVQRLTTSNPQLRTVKTWDYELGLKGFSRQSRPIPPASALLISICCASPVDRYVPGNGVGICGTAAGNICQDLSDDRHDGSAGPIL